MDGGHHREVNGNTLEQFDESRVRNHWKRNKKASVDLLEGNTLAVDRQLEDQRILMEKNRNPQLHVPTKMDRVRSEQIIAKRGITRAVALKANVLNKIVREESGIHTYTLVPPPRSVSAQNPHLEDSSLDPEQIFTSYASESKKKPTVMSFGHRPSSASRTFNPATMRIRMKHGEKAPAPKEGKFGFGLPVGVLAKLLHAPKLALPGSEIEAGGGGDERGEESLGGVYDPHDLFSLPGNTNTYTFPPPSLGGVGGGGGGGSRPESTIDDQQQQQLMEPSWVSKTHLSLELSKARKKEGGGGGGGKNNKGGKNSKLAPVNKLDDRQRWDDAHHMNRTTAKEIFALKENVMAQNKLTLIERMTRYAALTVSDDVSPFCPEKQYNDRLVIQGKPPEPKNPSPVKGQKLFFDPLNNQLQQIKDHRVVLDREIERKHKAKDFQARLKDVPKVQYHPSTLLLHIQNGTAKSLRDISKVAALEPVAWEDFNDEGAAEMELTHIPTKAKKAGAGGGGGISKDVSVASFGTQMSLLSLPNTEAINLGQEESGLIAAMRKAKKGDKRALFNHFISQRAPNSPTSPNSRILAAEKEAQEAEARALAEEYRLIMAAEENYIASGRPPSSSAQWREQAVWFEPASQDDARGDGAKREEEEEVVVVEGSLPDIESPLLLQDSPFVGGGGEGDNDGDEVFLFSGEQGRDDDHVGVDVIDADEQQKEQAPLFVSAAEEKDDEAVVAVEEQVADSET